MSWQEEDEYEARGWRRGRAHPPGFGYVRASEDLLAPAAYNSSHRRSRSQGGLPAPNINIYNANRADAESRSPSPMRGRSRSRDRVDIELMDRIKDVEFQLGRERSRGRSDAEYYRDLQMQVALTDERARRDGLEDRLIDRQRLYEDQRRRDDEQRRREDEQRRRDDEQRRHEERREDRRDDLQRRREEELLADERARRDTLENRLFDLQRMYGDQRRRDEDRLALAEQRWRQLEDDRLRDATWQEKTDREEELWRKKAELRRLKDRIEASESDARLTSRLELEQLKNEHKAREAELKRKEDREKVLAEREKQEREAKEERKRIMLEIEHKEKEEEAERKRVITEYQQKDAEKKKQQDEAREKAIADYEKKKADEKKREDELRAKFKREEEEAKQKAKEEREAWKAKIEKEEREEKEKKKKIEKEMEEEMRRKMAKVGFQDNQIEAVLHPRRADRLPAGALPDQPLVTTTTTTAIATTSYRPTPTYVKIHKDHIDIETLRYFALPWEYDVDRDYIVILQELDTHETDLLFEHTRKLRRGTTSLLIEDRGRDRDGRPEYAFVRRRSKSARRGHSPRPILKLM